MKPLPNPTFDTADEVLQDAQTCYGEALAALLLDPTNANRDKVKTMARALGQAIKFAQNNPKPCCQKCGEQIKSTPYQWGSYSTLCGLCLDDLMNYH